MMVMSFVYLIRPLLSCYVGLNEPEDKVEKKSRKLCNQGFGVLRYNPGFRHFKGLGPGFRYSLSSQQKNSK
jgi:hypothetical protein